MFVALIGVFISSISAITSLLYLICNLLHNTVGSLAQLPYADVRLDFRCRHKLHTFDAQQKCGPATKPNVAVTNCNVVSYPINDHTDGMNIQCINIQQYT